LHESVPKKLGVNSIKTLHFSQSFSIAMFFSSINIVVSSAIKIARVPLILSFLGASQYGFWITLLGLSGLALSFEYILASVVIREISLADASNKSKRYSHYLAVKGSCRAIYLKYSIGLALLVQLAISVAILNTNLPVDYWVAFLASAAVVFSSFIYLYSTLFIAILDGINDMWAGKLTKLIYEICGFLMIILGFLLFQNFLVLVVSLVLQSCLFASINYFFYKKMTRDLKPDTSVLIDMRGEMNSQVKSLCFVQSSTLLYILGPTLLIPFFFNYETAAAYSVIAQLVQLGPYIMIPIISAYLPRLAREVKLGNIYIYIRMCFILLFFIYLFYGLLYINFETIIHYWVGDDLFVSSLFVFMVIVVSIFEVSYLAMRQILICTSEKTELANIAFKSAVVFVVCMSLCCIVIVLLHNRVEYLLVPSVVTVLFVMNFQLAKLINNNFKLPQIKSQLISLFFLVLIIPVLNYLKIFIPGDYGNAVSSVILVLYIVVTVFVVIGVSGFMDVFHNIRKKSIG
jgi:O-antigen/teichoic acid export membrane protein